MADAYFSADYAASNRKAKDERERLVKEYETLVKQYADDAAEAREHQGEGFIGDIVSWAVAGLTFAVTGNPVLAYESYKYAETADDYLYNIIEAPKVSEDLGKISAKMEDYNWETKHQKYGKIEDTNDAFEMNKELESELAGKKASIFADEFDQDHWKDLMQLVVEVGSTALGSEKRRDVFDTGMSGIMKNPDKWSKFYTGDIDKMDGAWDFFKGWRK